MNELAYKKVYQSDGTYWIRETAPDGTSRRIEEYQTDYVRWLAAGGVPDDVPYVPPSLESVKAAKKAEIAAARWNEMSAPATVDGFVALWYANKESLNDMNRASINLQRAIAAGHKSADTTVDWKTANGTFFPLSLNDLITIELLLTQRQEMLYAQESARCAVIDAATTVAEVEAISWSQP